MDSAQKYVSEFLVAFVKKFPITLFLFLLFIFVIILQDLVMPHFSGLLVNAIQNKLPLVKPFIYIIIVIISIQAVYAYSEWQDAKLYPEMHGMLRDHIVQHLFKVNSANYAEIDIAGVLMRAIKLPATLFNFFDQIRFMIVPYIFVYTATISYIAYHDIVLGVIITVALGIIFMGVFMSPISCNDLAFRAEGKAIAIADEMEDVFTNLISVYSQNEEGKEMERIHNQHVDFVKHQRLVAKCIYRMKFIMFPIMIIFTSAFMYRCYHLVKKGRMNAGKFVSLFLILTYLSNSMWRVINEMRETIPRWGRIREGLTMFDKEAEMESENITATTSNVVQFNGIYADNISFKYPKSNNFIISDMTLAIPIKQNIAIVGRIGCGKTTLLKLLMKYYTATRGQIYWNSVPYSQMTAQEIRYRIGYVHQSPTLFKRTIYENISYGLDTTAITREEIVKILGHINMENIFDNVGGLDANVGRKGSKLSGGQRQMVWLLRTFFKHPDVLILDEPTASVDLETKVAIQKMLELIMKDKTVIIVTHDEFLLGIVDRVVTMENGVIIKDEARQQSFF